MGSKWLGILNGAIAVSLVFPQVVSAESTDIARMFPALAGINLTSEQQKQLGTLAEKTIPEVQKALNSEQKLKFDRALASGKNMRTAIQSLDLPYFRLSNRGNFWNHCELKLIKSLPQIDSSNLSRI